MPRIYNEGVRTWFIFVLITGLLGFLNVGAPIDLFFNAFRAKLIEKPVSGETVVIGVDDDALKARGAWPWSGETLSALHQSLEDAGAERIVYTMPLKDLSEEQATVFANAVESGDVKTYLSISLETFLGGERDVRPTPPLDEHPDVVSVASLLRFWNGVEYLDYKTDYSIGPVKGLAAELTGVQGRVGEGFPIDYSLRASKIPYYSASQVLDGAVPVDELAGKDVLIGLNSRSLVNSYNMLGQRGGPLVFVHALGMETLKKGRPLNFSFWPFWIGAVVFSFFVMRRQKWIHSRAAANSALVVVAAAPWVLHAFHIHIQVSSALVMLTLTAVAINRKWLADKHRSDGSVNPVSGLKTINAVRQEDGNDERFVVSVCVRRFTEIISALPPGGERAVVQDLVKRLKLCIGETELYQGEDGGFYWFVDQQTTVDLDDQFRAMSLIFRTPLSFQDQSFDVNVSFGVDVETGLSLSSRLINALTAARDAEREEVLWKQYDPAKRDEKTWELTFRTDLERALDVGEIWVAFQPQIALKDGRLKGCEALVRWTHNKRGPISPQLFVDQAERSGCIEALTDFVLDRSLALAKDLSDEGAGLPISVNLSPRLLDDAGLVDKISQALSRHDVPANLLTLEITETRQIFYSCEMQERMLNLRDLGVGLSIDDYGTGMSTLEYLRKIPATELKIDRCFTSGICTNEQDRVLIKSTVELAHALNMSVVVEGVETMDVQQLSRQLGADLAQGYGISRPLSVEDFVSWVTNYRKIALNYYKAC